MGLRLFSQQYNFRQRLAVVRAVYCAVTVSILLVNALSSGGMNVMAIITSRWQTVEWVVVRTTAATKAPSRIRVIEWVVAHSTVGGVGRAGPSLSGSVARRARAARPRRLASRT